MSALRDRTARLPAAAAFGVPRATRTAPTPGCLCAPGEHGYRGYGPTPGSTTRLNRRSPRNHSTTTAYIASSVRFAHALVYGVHDEARHHGEMHLRLKLMPAERA